MRHEDSDGAALPTGGERAGFRLRGFLIVISAVVAITSFLFRESNDSDVWWLVAIGRDIIASGEIPFSDLFSTVGFGRPYHDSHWLFQVMLATADRAGGMTAVTALAMGIWGLIFLVTYRSIRQWVPPVPAVILLFFASMGCNYRFLPRPEIITFLFVSLFYLRLNAGRYRTIPDLALLAASQAVWANCHGLFVIGPFMVACHAASEWCLRIRRVPSGLPALVAVLAATFVTPYGFDAWRYSWLLLTEVGNAAPSIFRNVAELSPTLGRDARRYVDFWAFLAFVCIFLWGVAQGWRRKTSSPASAMIVLALLAAAATAIRNIPLFVLVAAPFSAEQLRGMLKRLESSRAAGVAAGLAMAGSAWLPLSGTFYQWGNYQVRFGVGPSETTFSESFPEFFRRSGFTGQLFNSNNLGGYCLYHGIRPMTDGRWEVYDPDELAAIMVSLKEGDSWRLMAARYDIRGFLLQHHSYEARVLLPQLAGDGRWKLVYCDQAVSFWTSADGEMPASARCLEPSGGLAGRARIEEYRNLLSFLSAVNEIDAARHYLLEALRLFGDREDLLVKRVELDLARRSADAEASAARLYRRYPDNAAALNFQAYFALNRGDREAALRFLTRAVELDPENLALRENYLKVVRGE